ncbi:MAGE domain-containing protein [Helicobacter sp. CaF467b]|uniref:MAGE domain-containing protein n=1 Tax=Helicobacter sp. CaF467b TaxID=2919923 RepID=UPI001F5750DA|nr:MAGE domain-containing protein [Helicobacter sp. CaF467b]MCI2236843.1 MAGE domain-containing protein [Helicobacter sp. CaF467b]
MKSIKFLALCALFSCNLAFANSFYEPNSKSFKDGFEAGLKALEFQAKNDGFQPKEIPILKPYILVFDISKTPLNEVLFLQNIASREGFKTQLTKNFLSFGEFEREADAKELEKQLLERFKIKTKVLKNTDKIITYPYLFTDFFQALLNKARDEGILIETKIIETKPKITRKAISQTPKNLATKSIEFKNSRAMSYYLRGELDSKNIFENGLIPSKIYPFGEMIKTPQGENFVKVKDKNLYFSIEDVFIKGE